MSNFSVRQVTTMDSNQRIVAERLDAISSYITTRGLPTPVGRRLRRYFRHFYSQKTAIDEQVPSPHTPHAPFAGS